jgi:hypothetical protein
VAFLVPDERLEELLRIAATIRDAYPRTDLPIVAASAPPNEKTRYTRGALRTGDARPKRKKG